MEGLRPLWCSPFPVGRRFVVDVPAARVDDYTMGLIEADIVRFFPVVFEGAVAVEPAVDPVEPVAEVEPDPEPAAEAKPARRGRPRKNPAEGSE